MDDSCTSLDPILRLQQQQDALQHTPRGLHLTLPHAAGFLRLADLDRLPLLTSLVSLNLVDSPCLRLRHLAQVSQGRYDGKGRDKGPYE